MLYSPLKRGGDNSTCGFLLAAAVVVADLVDVVPCYSLLCTSTCECVLELTRGSVVGSCTRDHCSATMLKLD